MRLVLVVMLAGVLNASALQLVDREREQALWADQVTGDSAALTALMNNVLAKQFPATAAQNQGNFVAVEEMSDLVLASSVISPTKIYFRVIHFHLITQPTKGMVGMVMVTPSNRGFELFLLSAATSDKTGN